MQSRLATVKWSSSDNCEAVMEYRKLGYSGLRVSALSFGSWVTFQKQIDLTLATECIAAAYAHGVNFFDNAEIYARGASEEIMGQAIRKLGWRRGSYLISTKLFWGINETPNEKRTLNRKYLLEGIDGSLKRLGLDYVDLLFCHRHDPETTVEEVVWTMNDIIAQGKAIYWGVSEWPGEKIEEAFAVAERLNLRKPVMEQPEYSILARHRVEKEYASVLKERGLGMTTWSPLASGLLTGKYSNGIPAGSRLALEGFEWLKERLYQDDVIRIVKNLETVARDLDCSLAQLSIAWCLRNPHVSTVITGATSVKQIEENMKALEVLPKITAEIDGLIRKSTGDLDVGLKRIAGGG
jgi:voltage-dependent potassium channel beta subunit